MLTTTDISRSPLPWLASKPFQAVFVHTLPEVESGRPGISLISTRFGLGQCGVLFKNINGPIFPQEVSRIFLGAIKDFYAASPPQHQSARLQRPQKIHQVLLLLRRKLIEVLNHLCSL